MNIMHILLCFLISSPNSLSPALSPIHVILLTDSINSSLSLLSHPQETIKLAHKIRLSSTDHLFRFTFSNKFCLGNTIGQYLHLSPVNQPNVSRPLYPISPVDSEGIVDFLITLKNGQLSTILAQAKQGQQFRLSNPGSFVQYLGYGKFKTKDLQFKADKIGLITKNSTISTFLQLIHAVRQNLDNLQISILHFAQAQEDLYFAEQLLQMQRLNHNFNVNFSMLGQDPNWPGLRGPLTEQMFRDTMPVDEKTGAVLCGGSRARGWIKDLKLDQSFKFFSM